jgi:MYXO-CTERM domain-containing protein
MSRLWLPLSLALFLILPSAAGAAPLTWTLDGVVFEDGTTATGSFVFDADTTTFSALSIVTAGGSSIPSGSSWFFDDQFATAQQNAAGISGWVSTSRNGGDQTGAFVLSLFSVGGPVMTNAGGTIVVESGVVGVCQDSLCQFVENTLPFATLTSGSFVSPRVAPEPAVLWLAGLGIAALMRRRKSSSR